MSKIGSSIAILCAGLMIAQPCAAQSIGLAPSELRPSAFAGLNVSLPIGGHKRAEPSLRLQITTEHGASQRRDASRLPRPAGAEIGLFRTGKPALFLNGRQAEFGAENTLGLGGSGGQTALIVGGVLLAVVVIAVATGGAGPGDTCPTINGSRDHCINP